MALKKGISPLIAAVLLIAFTMTIAGILATWATTFSKERLSTSAIEGQCLGAIDLASLNFQDSAITAKIRNVAQSVNLTGLKASVEYTDTTKNKEYVLKNYGVPDPLEPSSTAFITINTAESAKPLSIDVVSSNCPRNSAILYFR